MNFPLGALAHLELGRAYARAEDTSEARAAYQDFLALWKDADPDIPILTPSQGGIREVVVKLSWDGFVRWSKALRCFNDDR